MCAMTDLIEFLKEKAEFRDGIADAWEEGTREAESCRREAILFRRAAQQLAEAQTENDQLKARVARLEEAASSKYKWKQFTTEIRQKWERRENRKLSKIDAIRLELVNPERQSLGAIRRKAMQEMWEHDIQMLRDYGEYDAALMLHHNIRYIDEERG